MSTPVRLFGAIHPHQPKHVAGLTLQIRARSIPDGAVIRVTDIQLEPGSYVTGWTLASQDLGVEAVDGWQFRNGVVKDDLPVVVTSDIAEASPTRWDIRGSLPATVQVAGYQFGETLDGSVHGYDDSR